MATVMGTMVTVTGTSTVTELISLSSRLFQDDERCLPWHRSSSLLRYVAPKQDERASSPERQLEIGSASQSPGYFRMKPLGFASSKAA